MRGWKHLKLLFKSGWPKWHGWNRKVDLPAPPEGSNEHPWYSSRGCASDGHSSYTTHKVENPPKDCPKRLRK